MLVGTAFAWTGVGLLVTANGADDTWAGIATMYYGEHVHTLKYRALYAATGSETVATIGEIGAGLASGAAVSRLNHLAKLAKQAQQASNVGEAVVRTADNAVETLANSADNFAVSAATQSPVKRFELPTIQSWCFAPDTLVDTPQGKRRIDEIRENDLVFAFDFTSGQWVERPVEVCHRNLYQGSLIEISTKYGTVVATAYHPFWVLEGHDLANRPRPRKLADTEDEGLALRGRWVNSHDLMAGDLIYSTEGRELRVLKIVQTYEEQFEVCNLTIAQNHSFAVGNDGVLVHNTGGCGDAARVGGLGYPGSMPGMLSKAPSIGASEQATIRARVLANIEASKASRLSSNFHAHVSIERLASLRRGLDMPNTGVRSVDGVLGELTVNGKAYQGINSWTKSDAIARQGFIDAGYVNPTTGKHPLSIVAHHAEGDAFLQAFRGGSRRGHGVWVVDGELCGFCGRSGGLKGLGKGLGLSSLEVWERLPGGGWRFTKNILE
jgi:hypothetical protein